MEPIPGPARALRRRSAAPRPRSAGRELSHRVALNQSLQYLRALAFAAVLLVAGGSALLALRRPTSCTENLRRIAEAKQRYAHDRGLPPGAKIRIAELIDQYLNAPPHCPAGGGYTFGAVGEAPRCSFVGHALPPDANHNPTGR